MDNDKGTSNPFFNDGKIPDSLTKENFWDQLYADYPEEMKKFCDWIDEYKKRVEWNYLFDGYNKVDQDGNIFNTAPKFHDIPIAMQIGIFYQYATEIDTLLSMKPPVDFIFDIISKNYQRAIKIF